MPDIFWHINFVPALFCVAILCALQHVFCVTMLHTLTLDAELLYFGGEWWLLQVSQVLGHSFTPLAVGQVSCCNQLALSSDCYMFCMQWVLSH